MVTTILFRVRGVRVIPIMETRMDNSKEIVRFYREIYRVMMDHNMEKNMEVEATSSCHLGFSESRMSFTVEVRGDIEFPWGKTHGTCRTQYTTPISLHARNAHLRCGLPNHLWPCPISLQLEET